ncbi:hypothetical protein ACFL3Z_00340 [Gemmatimonadota bacterium]
MKTRIRTLSFLGLVALATAACNEGITDGNRIDEARLRAEVALVSADGVLQDLDLFRDPGLQSLGFGGGGLATPGQGGQCQSMGIGGGFQCSPMTRDGFTFERTVTFYDADGNLMDAFDPSKTDKIHMVVDATGSRERASWSATMDRHREFTLEGLLGSLHTANGTRTEHVYRSRDPQEGESRSFDMTGSSVITDVVHQVPRSENPYPLSGTVTREVHVVVMEGDEVLGERDLSAVITFDGTRYATMTVNGETFQIDLDQRRVMGRIWGRGG